MIVTRNGRKFRVRWVGDPAMVLDTGDAPAFTPWKPRPGSEALALFVHQCTHDLHQEILTWTNGWWVGQCGCGETVFLGWEQLAWAVPLSERLVPLPKGATEDEE